MLIYFDMEFAGLHQATTPISLACISEHNHMFYARFTDYDAAQVDDWIRDNVLANVEIPDQDGVYEYLTDRHSVGVYLSDWLHRIGCGPDDKAVFVGDVLAYDWVLLCELFGGSMKLPPHIYYIPIDFASVLYDAGVDTDIDREEFSGLTESDAPYYMVKHNALYDTWILKHCCRLMAVESTAEPLMRSPSGLVCAGWTEMAHTARVAVRVVPYSRAPGDVPEPLHLCAACYRDFQEDHRPGTYMVERDFRGVSDN